MEWSSGFKKIAVEQFCILWKEERQFTLHQKRVLTKKALFWRIRGYFISNRSVKMA